MRSGAFRSNPGILCQSAATIQCECHIVCCTGEFDVLATEALGHLESAVEVELLAGLDVFGAEQQHEAVDCAGGGPLFFFDDVAIFQIEPSGA